MNRFIKTVTAALLFFAGLAFISSCSKEYDLSEDNFDKTITVGGKAFVFPIGNTDTMTITKLVDTTGFENLKKDENGNFFLEVSHDFSQNISIANFTDNVALDAQKYPLVKEMVAPTVPYVPDPEMEIKLPLPIASQVNAHFDFADAVKEGLVRADSISFRDAGIMIDASMSITGSKSIPNPLHVKIVMSVPERYNLDKDKISGGKLTFEGEFNSNGYFEGGFVKLYSIRLDDVKTPPFNYDDVFTIEEMTLTTKGSEIPKISGKNVNINLGIFVKGGQKGGDKLVPDFFYGLIDRKMDPVTESLKLENIPDFFKNGNAVMDFTDPHILAMFATNIGVKVDADMSIVPIFGLSPDWTREVAFSVAAPVSPNPEEMASENYWIGPNNPNNPDYQFVKANLNLLMQQIPDSIRMKISPCTDTEVSQHVIDCSASSYSLDADCDFVIPFSFGEKFSASLKDTINDLPELFAKVISNSNVTLTGDAESTMPLNFRLAVSFLDENKNPMAIETSVQTITGVTTANTPVHTPLNISIKQNPMAKNAKYLVVEFTALSGPTSGISVTDKSYLRLEIKASVPGGVTIDLDDTDNK